MQWAKGPGEELEKWFLLGWWAWWVWTVEVVMTLLSNNPWIRLKLSLIYILHLSLFLLHCRSVDVMFSKKKKKKKKSLYQYLLIKRKKEKEKLLSKTIDVPWQHLKVLIFNKSKLGITMLSVLISNFILYMEKMFDVHIGTY